MFTTVLFDLDGTLLDTLQDLAAAGNHALSAMGLPTHPVTAYEKMVGNGIPKLIERMLPEGNRGKATRELAADLFAKYYDAHNKDFTVPYPGIENMLSSLGQHSVSVGVVSNKADIYVRRIVDHYFPGVFSAVTGPTDTIPPKPDPAMVYYIMEELGAEAARTLYVGDSDVDMITAKNAGLCACGVLWGFRGEDELRGAGANHLCASAEELTRLILDG